MESRKRIFYLITLVFLAILIGLAYSLSLLVGSVVNKKWAYLDKGIHNGMVEVTNNTVADKSFNESTLDGANLYAKYNQKYFTDSTEVGFLVPNSMNDFNDYQDLQRMAFDNGAEFIASTGFNLIDSILGLTVYTDTGMFREDNGTMFNSKYRDKKFLIVDDSTHSSSIARNVVSVRFETQYAGFAAGIAASIYATQSQSYRVSAYGGLAFDSVFDWMSGYEQAINWFNYAILGYDLSYEKTNNDALLFDSDYSAEPVHLINGYNLSNKGDTGDSLYINYNKATSQDNANLWYTGSFDIGDATTISTKQLDAGSKVIFPVAAGQVVDTLNQIAIYNQNSDIPAYVIGVDTDASKQYTGFESYILGSGTKNIKASLVLGMWYIDRFTNEDKYDFVLPADHYVFEDAFEFAVSNTPDKTETFTINDKDYEIHGWEEYNEIYTSRDYARMTDDEVRDDYMNNPDPSIAYSNDIAYEDYGTKYPKGYGSELVGTYDNKGVGFVDSTYLEDSFDILLAEYNDISGQSLEGNFYDFLAYAFLQNPVIENASNTFSAPGRTPLTSGLHDQYPWIPDWDIYTKN